MKKIALAGNPNCGKTTLFNVLTGSTAHVGNWPGVTVDKKEGIYKKAEEKMNIIDLPGIYSLSPYSPEEIISRNYILNEHPDAVINVIDATNLERNLYLTTQLLEMDVPLILALNMMDVVTKNGDTINPKALEDRFGVPVVCISAQKGYNLKELMDVTYSATLTSRKGNTVLMDSNLSPVIDACVKEFETLGVTNPLFHAIKLVEMDEIEVSNYPQLVSIVEDFKKIYKNDIFETDLESVIADSRYHYISNKCADAKTKNNKTSNEKLTMSDKVDRVLTNKWLGIPIFLLVLFLTFHLTFSENLFFLGGLIKFEGPSFAGSFFEGLLWTESGINSLGVILFNFVDCITAGITDAVALSLEGSAGWVSGLICDGILGGLFSVVSFLPQILVLFMFFSILEDSGYMARVAFILDRIFRRFGLSGRAFMPMIMGFGCSIPAMINTRTLADEKERTATIRVIPFFSCGAKLPILLAIAGAIVSMTGLSNPDVITYSMYVLGMTIAIIAVIVMRHTTMRGDVAPFIMELPTYHFPRFKSLMLHLWDKCKHFIKKAFTIILASTIVIWFLQSFTFDWKYIEPVSVPDLISERFNNEMKDENFKASVLALNSDFNNETTLDDFTASYLEQSNEGIIVKYDEIYSQLIDDRLLSDYNSIVTKYEYNDTSDSILAGIGQLIQPIFTPLGFGSNLNENGWVFGVSAVTGLIAKENVVATFAVLSQCQERVRSGNATVDDLYQIYFASIDEDGAVASQQMILNSGIDAKTQWPILIAFIVFNMTTIPCFAAVATAKAELKKGKLKNTLLFWIVTSYISASTIYVILSWWWTVFIYAFIGTLVGILIHRINRIKDGKRSSLQS